MFFSRFKYIFIFFIIPVKLIFDIIISTKRNTEIKKYPLNEASNEKKEPDSTEIISIKEPIILLLGSSLCKKESEGL